MQQQLCQADYLINCPQIIWSHNYTDIGKPNSVLKRGNSHKQNIYWFEHLSSNRIPEHIELMNLYQPQDHSIKKLDKQVFFHEGTTKLHKLAPIKFKTKQLLLFKKQLENLHVVHICQPQQENLTTYQNKWINFVQQFSSFQNKLIYKMVISYEKTASQIQENLYQKFINQRLSKIVSLLQTLPMIRVKQVQSKIICMPVTLSQPQNAQKARSVSSISMKDNPSYSQQHLRLNKFTNQQKKLFCKMQQQFPTASDNELCRFLVGKNFNLQESIKLYSKYLAWKSEASKKYTMDSFKSLTDKRMFLYCGNDKKGRPIIYNQTSAVIPKELDEDLYCQFYKYYFEIYIPSKMKGYVDQMVILANGKGLGFKNFKISLTKRNMSQMLDIAPQRQAKLTAVNVNWFGTTVWAVLKPLLPAKSVDKIAVYGSNQKEYLPKLQQMMDISLIPKLIGGENQLQNNY